MKNIRLFEDFDAGNGDFDYKAFCAMMGFDDEVREAFFDGYDDMGFEEPSFDIYHVIAGDEKPDETSIEVMKAVYDNMIQGTEREKQFETAVRDFQTKMKERRDRRMGK